MNISTRLYRAARLSADIRALRSPETAARRAKNKAVARGLGIVGFWRLWSKLWR